MVSVTLARYLATVIMIPLMIPLAVTLIPSWRFSTRRMVMIALLLETAVVIAAFLVYRVFGSTLTACYVAGYLIPALCVPVFLSCCQTRDSRLLFIFVTIAIDNILCDYLSSMLVSRSSYIWLVSRTLITLAQAYFIWRFWRRPFWDMLAHNTTLWYRIALAPLFFCVYFSVLYSEMLGEEGRRVPVFPTLILCVAVVLVYTILYYFQQAILDQAETRRHGDLLQAEVESLQRQTEMAEHAADNVRIFRHDLRHYVCLLEGCLEAGEVGTAQKILASMEQNTALSSPWTALHSYTGSPLLDTVLTRAAERAQREGVAFTVRLTLPQQMRVDMTEFAVVVSNALENAITAAAKCPPDDRVVLVEDHPCQQQLFLVISNTWTGKLDLDERSGLPRTEKIGHGHGTRSMERFARKYDCLLNCSVQEQMFYLRLLI